jgi:ribosomal silencing factor RsfS
LNVGTRAAHRRNKLCAPLNAETMRKKPESGKGWNQYVKEGIEQPMTSKRQPEGPLEDDPSLPMVEDIIRSCDERKADFIWAARVAHLTYTTSFFVNVQGTSRPMLQAIAGNIEEMMSEKHEREIKWQVRYLSLHLPKNKWTTLNTRHS